MSRIVEPSMSDVGMNDGAEMTSSNDTDPLAANGAGPMAANDTDPMAANDTDPLAASGAVPLVANGAVPLVANGADPLVANGADPLVANGAGHAAATAEFPATTSSRRQRLALYSHDTMGIGHLRRNLLIAKTLMRSGQAADCLLIAGARQVAAFSMPLGVDCVTLPSLFKHASGRYCSRSLRMSLSRLIELRSEIILSTLKAYQPDLFLVDKNPRGVAGELDRPLEMLKELGGTRCVLGLRDVLDTPEQVRREWRQDVSDEAINAFYDAVWVYGDPHIYDPVREYQFPADVASKVRFTGYFDQRSRLAQGPGDLAERPEDSGHRNDGHRNDGPRNDGPSDNGELLASLRLPPGRLAVCMVGGGQDGEGLADAFVRSPLPAGFSAVLVTGPCMPPDVRKRLHVAASESSRLRIVEFTPDPMHLLQSAERVVMMGGYNTVTEALSLEKRVLVVPRVVPRLEQWIRAERLRELGLVDVLHPSDVTPAAIGHWLSRELDPHVSVHRRFDFGGLARLPELLAELRTADIPAVEAINGPPPTDRRPAAVVVAPARAK